MNAKTLPSSKWRFAALGALVGAVLPVAYYFSGLWRSHSEGEMLLRAWGEGFVFPGYMPATAAQLMLATLVRGQPQPGVGLTITSIVNAAAYSCVALVLTSKSPGAWKVRGVLAAVWLVLGVFNAYMRLQGGNE